jgi:hypothetical protein
VSRTRFGTTTENDPWPSETRNGFSRTTGVRATLVKGGEGQPPAGGFFTPTNTIFQFEPFQLPHSVLRDIHCCCVPESTPPSTTVSAIHPPLAHPWF